MKDRLLRFLVWVPYLCAQSAAFQSLGVFGRSDRLPFLLSSRRSDLDKKQVHLEINGKQERQHAEERRRIDEWQRLQLEGQATMTSGWDEDALEVVRHFTETAIKHRGQAKGFEALEVLAERCKERSAYSFDEPKQRQFPRNDKRTDTIVSRVKELLPYDVTTAFLKQVQTMEENGYMSTNPDSVDGLPSLHINLVSGGKPIVSASKAEDNLNEFEQGVRTLLSIVQPYIYNDLLPEVNRLLNTTSIRISDVFLRRYGEDNCGTVSRNGIGAHYDVFSRVTSVIALDNVASNGNNGLYTTFISPQSTPSPFQRETSGATSNHASLRRFFPLSKGDAVVHTWDVLHGVDVEPGLDRTSLIVWFTTEEQLQDDMDENAGDEVAPWIENHPNMESNDVAQFVLASALDSSSEVASDPDVLLKQHRLYLSSASQGNTFALTRMGSLFADQEISPGLEQEALDALESLRPSSLLPNPIHRIGTAASTETELSRRFWFEGAVRGNPLAQQSLADCLMEEAAQTGDEDTRLLASILFAIAAQQGNDEAIEALSRVVQFDLSRRGVQSEEDFMASPVVQVAQAAMSEI